MIHLHKCIFINHLQIYLLGFTFEKCWFCLARNVFIMSRSPIDQQLANQQACLIKLMGSDFLVYWFPDVLWTFIPTFQNTEGLKITLLCQKIDISITNQNKITRSDLVTEAKWRVLVDTARRIVCWLADRTRQNLCTVVYPDSENLQTQFPNSFM